MSKDKKEIEEIGNRGKGPERRHYSNKEAENVAKKGSYFTNRGEGKSYESPQKGTGDSQYIAVKNGDRNIGSIQIEKGDVKFAYEHKKGFGGAGGSPAKIQKREGGTDRD